MHCKMLSAKWRQFCLGLNVLKVILPNIEYIYVGKAARYKIGSVFPGQHQRPHLSVLERLPSQPTINGGGSISIALQYIVK